MRDSCFTSVIRHVDLNQIIQYIVDNGLILEEFKIDGDYIKLLVSGEHVLDIGMFEEFIGDLELAFDEALQ